MASLLRALLVAALLWGSGAGARVLELNTATVVLSPGTGPQVTQTQALPLIWDQQLAGQDGWAEVTLKFDIDTQALARSQDPWGLYLPRVGNTYVVWLNGVLLHRQGNPQVPGSDDFSMLPRYVDFPAYFLQPMNELKLQLRADMGRKAGLAPMLLGPQNEVEPLYQSTYHWRSTTTLGVVVFGGLVGLISLAIWFTQPAVGASSATPMRRDAMYRHTATAELAWTLGAGYMFVESPPLPWPWWGVLAAWAAVAWRAFMVLACIEAAGLGRRRPVRWFQRWTWLQLGLTPLALLAALAGGMPRVLTWTYLAEGVGMLVFTVYYLRHAWSQPQWQVRALSVALAVNLAVGIRDLVIYRVSPTYVDITWLRYSSVMFGLVMLAVVLTRFRQATEQAREAMGTLEARVALRERELQASFEQLEALAREQERTAERTRILRDMHDGVGAHISAAMRQLQSPEVDTGQVLLTLRDSLDQLKLSIDSLNLPAGDITALLANLRYRLEPRFAAMGMQLDWQVDELPVLHRLDAGAMRQLLFILFESISNTLQHAHARRLHVQARAASPPGQQQVRIVLEDDGCGFDVAASSTRGLASMRQRARLLGAELQVQSTPKGTRIELGLS